MAVKATKQAGFEELEPGIYHMVCSQVIEVGTPEKPDKYGKREHKVLIGFETPDETTVIDGVEKRMFYSDFFPSNTRKKSTKKLIAAVNDGKGITPEEEKDGYELGNLINQNFTFSIGLNDNGKLVIESIQRHKGVPATANEVKYFDAEKYEEAGHKYPDWMSDGIKRMLMACEEYKLPF